MNKQVILSEREMHYKPNYLRTAHKYGELIGVLYNNMLTGKTYRINRFVGMNKVRKVRNTSGEYICTQMELINIHDEDDIIYRSPANIVYTILKQHKNQFIFKNGVVVSISPEVSSEETQQTFEYTVDTIFNSTPNNTNKSDTVDESSPDNLFEYILKHPLFINIHTQNEQYKTQNEQYRDEIAELKSKLSSLKSKLLSISYITYTPPSLI